MNQIKKITSILYLAFESGASTIQLHSKVRPLYLMKLFSASESFVTCRIFISTIRSFVDSTLTINLNSSKVCLRSSNSHVRPKISFNSSANCIIKSKFLLAIFYHNRQFVFKSLFSMKKLKKYKFYNTIFTHQITVNTFQCNNKQHTADL